MRGAAIDIETADGVADSYLVRPEGEALGGVLFIVDAFGVRDVTMEMADRIADEGYVVLAPNVLYRGGRAPEIGMPDFSDEGSRGAFMAKVKPLIEGAVDPGNAARDGAFYLDRLGEEVEAPFAITGYCMGGRVGWRVAAAYPERVAALACFHTAGLATDAPDSPHRSADRLRAELYLAFADKDPNMTPAQIGEVEQALGEAGVRYRDEVYAGALHGYTMADTPVFDEAARERHYSELFALLQKTFV